MPAYGTIPPPALYPGDSGVAFNAEQPASGVASQAFALGNVWENYPQSISMEVQFAGVPGAFEFDIQTADTDTANAYNTEANGTLTTVNAGNWGRVELTGIKAKFARVLCKTQNANAVNATVKLNR